MNTLEQIEDFTLFLFLHMARVDGSLHPNERETIIEKMRELFSDSSFDGKLETLELSYEKLRYGAAEELLKDGFNRFSTADPSIRKEIYVALFDIINANGRVNEEETQVLHIFKSWFTSGDVNPS